MKQNVKILWLLVALLTVGLTMVQASQLSVWHASGPHAIPRFKLNVLSTDATSVRLQWQPWNGATEYEISRDGSIVGRTVAIVGYFTDFGLQPGERHQYSVTAHDAAGVLARSEPASAKTTESSTIRTHYTVLAIAFNPQNEGLTTEQVYLKHRVDFLSLASLGAATIHVYQDGIISSAHTPDVEPGTNFVDYSKLVTRRDLPGLNGHSIVDLIERGDIDHVWVVKTPVDFAENVLIGNRPIQGEGVMTDNTWVPIPVKSSRSFFVNAFVSDERSWDAYAHMVEGIMTSISDGHPESWPRAWNYTVYTPDCRSFATTQAWLNLWERFRLADEWNGVSPVAYASKGNGNIGSSHFPPTAPRDCSDYAYSNIGTWQRYIDSVADEWLNFPSLSDLKRKLNGYDFGAFNNYALGDPSYAAALGTSPETHYSFQFGRASYHQWWFAHLPHNPGVSEEKLNSWWPHIFDFNRFNGTPITFQVHDRRKIPADFPSARGEYGTEERTADKWGYWHSQNGFSPGGKAATLSIVSKAGYPEYVRTGHHALRVYVENAQYWEYLGTAGTTSSIQNPETLTGTWRIWSRYKSR